MNLSSFIRLTCTAGFLLFFSLKSYGQKQVNNVNRAGVMAGGFDVVSYFTGRPLQGSRDIAENYQGVNYYFATEDNRRDFRVNPDKYVPQYGGWCAYAMGKDGSKVKIDPETYKITDGKLYLFYNFGKNNTLIYWNDDEKNLMSAGDKYWSKQE